MKLESRDLLSQYRPMQILYVIDYPLLKECPSIEQNNSSRPAGDIYNGAEVSKGSRVPILRHY